MSTWTTGFRLNGGDLDGQYVYTQTKYPNKELLQQIPLYSTPPIDRTWSDPTQIQMDFWNPDTYSMMPLHTYFQPGASQFSNQKIASIPLYENDTQTGNFVMLMSHPNDRDYSITGRVEDVSGQVLANCSGACNFSIQRDGAFAHAAVNAYFAFAKWKLGDDDCLGFYFNICNSALEPNQGSYWATYVAGGTAIKLSALYDAAGIDANNTGTPVEKSPEFGPSSEPGGYGPGGSEPSGGSGGPAPTFNGESDPWTPTPTKPGVLSFGLLNLYKCDTGALNQLGSELFPTISKPPVPSQSGVTEWVKWVGEVVEWVGDIIFALSDSIWNKDLIDYIISVHLIPVDVTGGNLEDIKIGPRTMTGILARPITADVVEIDLESVKVDEYYTNYADYMTRCRLYLPFYGFIDLKPEFWQSATLQVKYLWNVVDGSFIAQVFSTITRHQKPCTTMIGQYSGNACVHLPLSGTNYANMFASLAGGVSGIAAGAASGNVAVAATSAMNLAGSLSGDMQQSNAYNASSAFYGHARPYLIIERPVSHFSTRYYIENGLPLIKNKKIGDCSGFTTAEDIILDGIPCTEAEKEKIRAMFRSGVIIR